jgi:hypothetical protein
VVLQLILWPVHTRTRHVPSVLRAAITMSSGKLVIVLGGQWSVGDVRGLLQSN